MAVRHLSFPVGDTATVSALWDEPRAAKAVLVLAHGAGAGMTHKAMTATAEGLAARGVAVLRYNFPYMERGSKRPDVPALAQATVRAAAEEARRLARGRPVFAGGRSFGGRMTSQAQAGTPLPGVSGLVFFAFPLHPSGAPAVTRADHLVRIGVPMLFLQGTRDTLARLDLIEATVAGLGPRATLHLAADADHSFHVPAITGRTDAAVLGGILDTAAAWMFAHVG
jgi:predicted alpha/beta-hydrolase family hydrolase